MTNEDIQMHLTDATIMLHEGDIDEATKMINFVIKELGRPSSNGRTTDFGSVNRGSSPCGLTIKHKWGTEAFLLATEGPDVFDPYDPEDYGDRPPMDSEDW